MKYVEKLERMLIDLLDGVKEHDISANTGLTMKRSCEIYNIFHTEVLPNCIKRGLL